MSAEGRKLPLDDVNRMSREEFTARIGPVFEGPPWIVREAWEKRPFASVEDLYATLCEIMNAAPTEQKEALLAAHPDLVGRAALAGTLGPESTREQASAGLGRLSPEEIERFNALNAAYRERFGFPFVICARENKKESILARFQARMNNPRDREIQTALDEVTKIARLRLADLVTGPGSL